MCPSFLAQSSFIAAFRVIGIVTLRSKGRAEGVVREKGWPIRLVFVVVAATVVAKNIRPILGPETRIPAVVPDVSTILRRHLASAVQMDIEELLITSIEWMFERAALHRLRRPRLQGSYTRPLVPGLDRACFEVTGGCRHVIFQASVFKSLTSLCAGYAY